MADCARYADDKGMRCSPWAKPLAIVSLLLPTLGAALLLHSAGSLAGLVLIGAGAPVAFAGWLALGRPVRHRRA
jgi:hypothetical protein